MISNRLLTAMRSIGSGLSEGMVQALYPTSCAGCGKPGQWFCDRCTELLQEDLGGGCYRCGRRGRRQPSCERCESIFPTSLRRSSAAFLLDGPMRRAIHRFKYHGEYERGRDLAVRMTKYAPTLLPKSATVDAVVPVPLHPRRYRQRGFNQASILADQLASELNVPVVHATRRVRNTASQTSLDETARTENLAGAFQPDEEFSNCVAGKRIVIVDDVTTTGATVAGVATCLESAGAATVYAIALARER